MPCSNEKQHREKDGSAFFTPQPPPRPVPQDSVPHTQGAGRVTLFCLGNPADSLHAFKPDSSLKPFGMTPSGLENVLQPVL